MMLSELIKQLEDIRDSEGDIRVLVDGNDIDYDDPGVLWVQEFNHVGYEPLYIGSYQEYYEFPGSGEIDHFRAVVIPR